MGDGEKSWARGPGEGRNTSIWKAILLAFATSQHGAVREASFALERHRVQGLGCR